MRCFKVEVYFIIYLYDKLKDLIGVMVAKKVELCENSGM